jgi:hypothetical protein
MKLSAKILLFIMFLIVQILLNGKTPLVEVVMMYYNPFNKPPMAGIFWVGIPFQVFQAIKQKHVKVETIIG